MGLILLLVLVFQTSQTVAYLDITFFIVKALPSLTGGYFIGGYSAGDAIDTVGTSFTYGRVIDTGTGDDLPSGYYETDFNDYARRLTLPTGAGRPGVYYCNASDVSIQTVQVALQAEIHPEIQTKTVSWGDDVTLTMTIQSTSISESQLKWKHNGVDKEAWHGQSSITITSAKPSDAGIYECYTTQQQRQDGLNGFMRLIVRRCPNGKYGDTCLLNCPTCYNGGICNAYTGECICPPGFTGSNCNTGCQNRGTWGQNCGRVCTSYDEDACRTRMFCVSDPYGCSCLASYTGLDCNTDCPVGNYGAGCTQTCHCTNGCSKSDADLLVSGECTISGDTCDDGWGGENCRVPSACPPGFYGEICNYNCHCKNNAACDKNTGVCPNGDCAPGWINLDTIDSDCQQDPPRFQTSNKPQVSDSQSDQLTVTWNKWTTDDIGDGPVESYKVYYRESGGSDWISGQVIPVNDTSQMRYTSTITGLQWSTQYVITVTVKRPGPLGEGSKDTTITETTLCATPQKPAIKNILSPELKQLEVHVQVPDSGEIKCKHNNLDGYIDYIKVQYRKAGTQDEYGVKNEVYQRSVTGSEVITVTDDSILPYTEYEVVALLSNADALSPLSNSVTIISNEDVPSKPRNVTLQPAVYTITVTWLKPDPPNGIITAYKITYWKTGDESTKKHISIDNGDSQQLNIDNLDYQVNYTVIVSASTSVGEGEYSNELNTKTTETIPREPASIDVQRTTENSIRFTWTDPTIFSGDISQYRITYKSSESVYTTTVLESKDILVEGSIHTHTLEELPPGTQFEISLSASTSKGFGKPKSIISGTKIGIDVSDILEEPHVTNEPILTETTATIYLRKLKSNTNLKTDTPLMRYIVVVEEKGQQIKRDLEENQYITSSFPLNAIPDQLIVGDGMEYNGYDNKPLTPGQQYVIYDGFAVYTTGVEELMLHDSQLTSFTAGGNMNIIKEKDNNISMFMTGFAVGVAVGVVVTIVVVVLLLYVIRRFKSHNKYKERDESHDDIAHARNESKEMRGYREIQAKENDHYQDLGDVQVNNYEELKMNEYRNVAKPSMQTRKPNTKPIEIRDPTKEPQGHYQDLQSIQESQYQSLDKI